VRPPPRSPNASQTLREGPAAAAEDEAGGDGGPRVPSFRASGGSAAGVRSKEQLLDSFLQVGPVPLTTRVWGSVVACRVHAPLHALSRRAWVTGAGPRARPRALTKA
jgi:hypothetical protein